MDCEQKPPVLTVVCITCGGKITGHGISFVHSVIFIESVMYFIDMFSVFMYSPGLISGNISNSYPGVS